MPSFINASFQKFDVFSTPITLTYKGKKSYRTCCGGLMSLILTAAVCFYIYLLITQPMKLEIKTIDSTNTSDNKQNVTVNNTTETTTDVTEETTNTGGTGSTGGTNTTQNEITWSKTLQIRESVEYIEGTRDTLLHNLTESGWSIVRAESFGPDSTIFSRNALMYYRRPGESTTNSALNLVSCNTTTFPIDFDTIAPQFQIGIHECSADSISLYGDNVSYDSNYLYFWYGKCSSGCKTDEEIRDFFAGEDISFISLDSYYDESDHTIKKYINYFQTIGLSLELYKDCINYIYPTEVVFLNGTSKWIYSTGEITCTSQYRPGYNNLLRNRFVIAPEKRRIEQYELYQPVITRMLGTTTTTVSTNTTTTETVTDTTNTAQSQTKTEEEKNEDTLYYVFFVMAQIGGFYTCLKMILGAILSVFSTNIKDADFINTLKEIITRSVTTSSVNESLKSTPPNNQPNPKTPGNKWNKGYQNLRSDIEAIANKDSTPNTLKAKESAKVEEEKKSSPVNKYQMASNKDAKNMPNLSRKRSMMNASQSKPYSYSQVIMVSICGLLKCRKKDPTPKQLSESTVQRFYVDREKLNAGMDVMKILEMMMKLKSNLKKLEDKINKGDLNTSEGSHSKLLNQDHQANEGVSSTQVKVNYDISSPIKAKTEKEKAPVPLGAPKAVPRQEIQSISKILNNELESFVDDNKIDQHYLGGPKQNDKAKGPNKAANYEKVLNDEESFEFKDLLKK